MEENKLSPVEWLINEIHKKEQGLVKTSYNHIFDKAKQMEQEVKTNSNVIRFEVINHSPTGEGREYTRYGIKMDDLSLQDEGKTLKIFLK